MNLEEMSNEESRTYFEGIPIEDLLREIQNPTPRAYAAHNVAVRVFNERRGKEIRDGREKERTAKENQKSKDHSIAKLANWIAGIGVLAAVVMLLFVVWDHHSATPGQAPQQVLHTAPAPSVVKNDSGKGIQKKDAGEKQVPIHPHDSVLRKTSTKENP
jgi:hypothetical protein